MLYLIATPIGNSRDMGARALELLSDLDVLLCEDTRRTGMLLTVLGVEKKPRLESFYDQVEREKIPLVMGWLEVGQKVGLVTDGGTPLISDPGWLLVKECRKKKVPVTAIPGPSALINAIVLSGLPISRFSFLGFLPKKVGDRKKILRKYLGVLGAKVVYESPNRLKRLLEELRDVFGSDVEVAVCREMTKKFEEVIKGDVVEVLKDVSKRKIRGEVVVVFI